MPRARQAVHPAEGGISKTKQADAIETDINKIVGKFIAHGTLPIAGTVPTYGDFSTFTTYHDALNLVMQAQNDFDDLPATVRKHVDNDPGKFLDLVHDPTRRAELEELGLVDEQAPPAAPPADPKPPDPVAPLGANPPAN